MPAVSPLPDSETIRQTAEEVLGRPYYNLHPQADSGASLLDLIERVLRWILKPIEWLLEALGGLPLWLRWPIVLGLVVVLVLLIVHIVYTIMTSLRGPIRKAALDALVPRQSRDPALFERQAREAVARGDFITAIRLLFHACLLRLEQAERKVFRAGTTNREHLRGHRDSPVFEPLKLFVETIETRWYGRGECGPADYEACLAAHARISQFAKDGPNADRA
jgi:hypothetical protein